MAITWEEIQLEAERRGYVLTVSGEIDDKTLHVAKKQFAHVNHSFPEHPKFSLDPRRADDYSLLQAYYWIRGYSLSYGDDGTMGLHRGMHHSQYDQRTRVAATWDYFWNGGMEGTHRKMLGWVEQVEQMEGGEAGRPQKTRALRIEGTSRTYLV